MINKIRIRLILTLIIGCWSVKVHCRLNLLRVSKDIHRFANQHIGCDSISKMLSLYGMDDITLHPEVRFILSDSSSFRQKGNSSYVNVSEEERGRTLFWQREAHDGFGFVTTMCLIQALHFLSIVVLFEQSKSIVSNWTLRHDHFLDTLAYTLRIWTARADIHADASSSYIGTLIFTQPDLVGSPVHVTGILKNLIPNTRYHGFHVHAYPIPENRWNCSEAGDHWNPYGMHQCDMVSVLIYRSFKQVWCTGRDLILFNVDTLVILAIFGNDRLRLISEPIFDIEAF